MALFMNNQQDNRSELQKRLAAELTAKAKKKAEYEDQERPDGVKDSAYLEDTKSTTSLAWAWALIGLFGLVGLILLIINLG